jgi:Cdc6-like AAA superfamily ATPase
MTQADLFSPDGFRPASDHDWDMLEASARQIFRPMAPIDDARLFAGRLKQISDLLDVIYQRGAHAILYGERGLGKTSLANIIGEKILGPLRFMKVLKISCDQTDTFATIWGKVFFDYRFDGENASDFIAKNPKPFVIYKLAETLDKNIRHLIIIDEFDRSKDEQAKSLTADTIKYFSNYPLNVTILVVGVGQSISELFGNHPSIARCSKQVPMQRMSRQELEQIIDDRLPKISLTTTPGAKNRMIRYAQGFPGYMHLLGQLSAMSAIKAKTQQINEAHVDGAVAKVLETSDESTRRDYHRAISSSKPDNKYREVLLACALAQKNDLGQFSAGDLREPYSIVRGKQVDIPYYAAHLKAFCDADRGPVLVKTGKAKGFKYHFANPLLEALVIMVGISDKLIKTIP